MNIIKKIIVGVATVGLLAGAAGCDTTEYDQREKDQAAKKSATKESLEKQNITKKIKLEENPDRIGYVYLLSSTGNFYGYYTVKGKISSSGSQLTPEEDIVRPYSGEYLAVDGPQDDGTYGEGDPGIFFFTSKGDYVETSVDYVYSSNPLTLNVKVQNLDGS